VELTDDLACRLQPLNTQEQAATFERPELAGHRTLLWDADYDLRTDVQVEVAGVTRTGADGVEYTARWNPVAGSYVDVRPPGGGTILYRRCRVVEALP
jgi:hypothetical protein